MLPDAPGLLSTTTGWPSARDSWSLTSRAVKSVLPPGAVGTTRVIARWGYLPWANSRGLVPARAAPPSARRWRRCMKSPWMGMEAGSGRLGNLDEVQVGITHVDRADRAGGACAQHRTFGDRTPGLGQPLDDGGQRDGRDEAEGEGAGDRQVGLRRELGALHVQVDLLLSELECPPLHRWRAAGERLQLHAQHARVEVDACGFAGRRQHQVVQVAD